MNSGIADPSASGLPGQLPRRRLIFFIALFFAVQLGFIFVFGTKKQIAPLPVKNVPQLQLANNAGGLAALDDPTLFALPHAHDFASAVWLKTPVIAPPDFRYSEAPRWLPLATEDLGANFQSFIATNRFAAFPLDFKPKPKLSEPVSPVAPTLAPDSTLQISGALAQRQLLFQPTLPSLPYNDVLLPSKVQALVDAGGNVMSVVLLESSTLDTADQNALAIARSLRFSPATQLTFGEIIFNWHTVPMTSTNTP